MKIVFKEADLTWDNFNFVDCSGQNVQANLKLELIENGSKIVIENIPGSEVSIGDVSLSEIMNTISNTLIKDGIAKTEGMASLIKEAIFPEFLFYMKLIEALKDKLINSGDVVVHYPKGPTINDNGSIALIKKEKGTGFYLNYVDPK